MLKRYLKEQKTIPENAIIDSLIDHTNIDDEEIDILKQIITGINKLNGEQITNYVQRIKSINNESQLVFEKITLKIIKSNFSHEKYTDILQLHQKIDLTSRYVSKTAEHLNTYIKIESKMPEKIYLEISKLINIIITMHQNLKLSLESYLDTPNKTLAYVHEIFENEKKTASLFRLLKEKSYILANNKELKLGSLSCLENTYNDLENISFNILNCGIRVECLLLYH